MKKAADVYASPVQGEVARLAVTEGLLVTKKSATKLFYLPLHRNGWYNPIGLLRRNNYPLFLPPKTASAVRLYGDVTIFDDSRSPFREAKKCRPKKCKQSLFNGA